MTDGPGREGTGQGPPGAGAGSGPGSGGGPARRWWAWVALAAGWALVGTLLVVVALRVFGIDRWSSAAFVVLTLLPVILVPAWFVALGAALTRSWTLLAAAGVVVVAHVAFLAPEVTGGAAAAGTGTPLRVATANLYAANTAGPGDWLEVLASTDAEVIVLQELTPRHAEAIADSPLAASHPHTLLDPLEGFFGSGILSTVPLEDPEVLSIGQLPLTTARVPLAGDGSLVRVASVHTLQPVTGGTAPLRAQLDDLAELARAWEQEPVVLAGDYNASAHHRPFRDFLAASGTSDAHRSIGKGLAVTWSTASRLPPLALLDHVVVSDEVAVVGVTERDLPGSDHRTVVADLAVR